MAAHLLNRLPMPAAMNQIPTPAPETLLSEHRVFGRLPRETLAALAGQARCCSHAPGTLALTSAQLQETLAVVASGVLELTDPTLDWSLHLVAGEWCGAGVMPLHQQRSCQARAISAATLVTLPVGALEALCREHPGFAYFFPSLSPGGSAAAVLGLAPAAQLDLLATPVRALLQRPALMVQPSTPIGVVAKQMCEQRVSSALLVEQDRLVGLVTDCDLRNRVVAKDLDSTRQVLDIATPAPRTVQASSPASEALLLMARHNIHHLPVLEGSRISGMLTVDELAEQHAVSAVHLASAVYQQSTLEGLVRISHRVPRLLQHLVAAELGANSIEHILTAITDALTRRLIELAQVDLGPAPVEYVWVAAGSQGRSEQTLRSDQDNCLVLGEGYQEPLHGAYFDALARFVCDGLDACGHPYCPGGIMAVTDQWRQPWQRWLQYFRHWLEEPDPGALVLSSVFFDQRAVHGSDLLLDTLRQQVLGRTRGKSLFIAHLVGNALKHRPPLGLLGSIALERTGDRAGRVDLKHSGTVPIIDLARVYALMAGVAAVNTHERLEQAAGSAELTVEAARDLRDALEFLGRQRLAHQARQIAVGHPPDNHLALAEISSFERSHLKEAFGIVQRQQAVLGHRYGTA